MFGIAFHSPSLVSLMIDRERFATVVVPDGFDERTQDALEELFSKKQKGTRQLLLIEGTSNLGRLAALFPEQKVRIIVFDVIDRLKTVTDTLIDIKEQDNLKRLVPVKPSALNHALAKMRVTALEDYRHDFTGDEEIQIAARDGNLAISLESASVPFKKTAIKYLLGVATFASLKRVARKNQGLVNRVQQYVNAAEGVNLIHAYMDMALYGTESKEAALLSGADLEDLRFISSLVVPEPDMKFGFEVPEKLRLAREE